MGIGIVIMGFYFLQQSFGCGVTTDRPKEWATATQTRRIRQSAVGHQCAQPRAFLNCRSSE